MKNHQTNIILYICGCILPLICGCSSLPFIISNNNPQGNKNISENPIYHEALMVCSGSSDTSTDRYVPEVHGIHPIVIAVRSGGTYAAYLPVPPSNVQSVPYTISKEYYPDGWFPISVKAIQLIACIDQNIIPIDTCTYENDSDGHTYTSTRYQDILTITVIEANSGRSIKSFTEYGGQPDDCPENTENVTNIFGPPVHLGIIWDELKILTTT